MGILNNLFTRLSGRNVYLQALWQMHVHDGSINYINDNPYAYIVEGYAGNADVYSIVHRAPEMGRNAKLKLYQKDKDGNPNEVDSVPELMRFLVNANPQMSMLDLYEAWSIFMRITGNAMVYAIGPKSGLNKGKKQELFILPVAETDIVESGDPFAPIKGYRIDGSWNKDLPAEDVCHTKYFNPLFASERSLWGMSPLKAAARVLSKSNQAEDTQNKMFQNQGPRYALFKDISDSPIDNNDNLTETQQRDIERKLKRHGQTKRGLPFIFKRKMGKLDLGVSPTDLNIIESSKDARRVLSNVYSWPIDLMNDPEGSTYNNKTTARKSAWTDAIMPMQARFAEMLNRVLINPVDEYVNKGYFFAWDYSDITELQADLKERVEWMRQANWTRDEIRVATGKDPIGGDFMQSPIITMGETSLNEINEPLNGEKDFSDYISK